MKRGEALVVLEAMKMEHTLTAPRDGNVSEVNATAGTQTTDGASVRLEACRVGAGIIALRPNRAARDSDFVHLGRGTLSASAAAGSN